MNLSTRKISFAIKSRAILHDINLEVQGGKTTILLGPNGAGESTLMRILSGYLKATAGEALIAGRDQQKLSLEGRARALGVLTQRSSLEFPFTAREVIAMGRMPFGVSEGFDEVTRELLKIVRCSRRLILHDNVRGGATFGSALPRICSGVGSRL